MAPVTAAPAKPTAPAPSGHLSAAAAKAWTAKYIATLTQAQLDYPGNDRAQRTAALKAANALLAVPAPDSAAAIDKLEEWQVVLRETRVVKGVSTRVCVTADGRKYSFAIPPAK
jgi:hypothetical protein